MAVDVPKSSVMSVLPFRPDSRRTRIGTSSPRQSGGSLGASFAYSPSE